MILKSETYHFHRLDLTRQVGFIVTIYDEDGLRLASTPPLPTPAQAFEEARKTVDNKVGGRQAKGKGTSVETMCGRFTQAYTWREKWSANTTQRAILRPATVACIILITIEKKQCGAGAERSVAYFRYSCCTSSRIATTSRRRRYCS